MSRTNRKNRAMVVGIAAFAALMLLGGLASADATIDMGSTASLQARGAALSVPIELTCSPDTVYISTYVNVTQRVGNQLAQGSGYQDGAVCDGTPHTITMVVTPYGSPFKKGVAFATAETYFCTSDWTCGQASDSGEIRIVKG